MDDEENDLFNIQVSDDSSDERETREAKQARRTGQSEEAWRAVQREYKPKVENGNIFKTIKLPISSSASKQDLQEAVHAVEELYFFRQYEHATRLVDEALGSDGIDDETRQTLLAYKEKCVSRQKKQT